MDAEKILAEAVAHANKMLREDAEDDPDRNDRIHEDALELCQLVVRLDRSIRGMPAKPENPDERV